MGDLWDVFSGKADAESKALDARLKVLNDKKLADGSWSRETYDLAEQHRQAGVIMNPVSDVMIAAKEGAEEGLDTVAQTFNDTVNSVASKAVGFTFKAIPVWVFIGVGLYIAFQLGWVNKWISKLRA